MLPLATDSESFLSWWFVLSEKLRRIDTLYNGVVLRCTSLKHFGLFNDPLVFQGMCLGMILK
jgi:hypothetical protein